MLNKIILIGRLVQDPELRYTPNGVAVARFTLAVDRRYNNRQGEKETDFIDIVVWQKLAEICSNNLSKGRLVAVDGELQIRSYDDRQGIRRKAAEVKADNVRFLDRKDAVGFSGQTASSGQFNDNNKAAFTANSSGYNASSGTESGPADSFDDSFGSEITFSEDDIPF